MTIDPFWLITGGLVIFFMGMMFGLFIAGLCNSAKQNSKCDVPPIHLEYDNFGDDTETLTILPRPPAPKPGPRTTITEK